MRIEPRKLKVYGTADIDRLPRLQKLSEQQRFEMKVVAAVFPFRANNYVVKDLIDWNNVPDDPIFQLTFPQRGMLRDRHFRRMARVLRSGAPRGKVLQAANEIRLELNPHPAGQMTINVPLLDGEPVRGLQHKYKETCLVFPSAGQTCHAFCTFCFRWPQFAGMKGYRFATDES
ncbi:MAG: lysine 2,3-aminomutase, partial [Planctomycetota bacterium]